MSGGVVREDESLARHTALRVGGTCDRWVVVHDEDELLDAITDARAAGLSPSILGLGTRTVVREGGLAGAVMRLGGELARVRIDGTRVTVGAGAPLAVLVDACVRAGLGGLTRLADQPGSVGAAVALDTAPEKGWAAFVRDVRWVSRGKVRSGELEKALKPKSPLLVGLTLELPVADASVLEREVDKVWQRSRAACWFKPLSRGSMRNAIDRAGMAGVRVNHIVLPDCSPDMLVNLGGASSKELAFIERTVIDRVRRERGIDLVPRMLWAGSHGARE